MRRHVVLPAPFGPSSPQTCPCSTLNVRSSTASTPAPKRFESPMISTTASVIGRDRSAERRGGSTRGERSVAPMAPTSARRPATRNDAGSTSPRPPCPSSPLPGLDACARFVDRVVGTLWWHERFPDRDLGHVPRLRPGQGRPPGVLPGGGDGPTITLPRRYRTKAVVLHELTHWALGIDSGLPHHGRTFARVLLDAVGEFCGPDQRRGAGGVVPRTRRARGAAPAAGPDGRLHYGWDERLRLGKGRLLTVSTTVDGEEHELSGMFHGYERGRSVLRFVGLDGKTSCASRPRRCGRCAMSAEGTRRGDRRRVPRQPRHRGLEVRWRS